MKRNYYLLFGYKRDIHVDELALLLKEKIGLNFIKRNSDYSGEYLTYEGDLTDRLALEFNYVFGDWKEEKFKEYQLLIYLSNKNGKNVDKEKKTKEMRESLLQIEGIVLLSEKVFES